MPTPWDLLQTELRRDGSRPFITFYDAAGGERVELSVTTTANWVAKTANYIVDELGADPGDTISIQLPLHWSAATFLLASWAAGLEVVDGEADIVVTTPDQDHSGIRDTVTLTLQPMGIDYSRLVAAQPDVFAATDPAGAEAVSAAAGSLSPSARVVVTASLSGAALDHGLVTPLATGASLVYVRHPEAADLAAICAAERVTHAYAVDVPGLLPA